jgi:hypothetical protein
MHSTWEHQLNKPSYPVFFWIANIMPVSELRIAPASQYSIEHSGRSMFSCFDVNNDSSAEDEHLMYGLGPSDLAPRDKVCVFQGCFVPGILRPVDDHHILIGEAMDGEAVKRIEEGHE